MCLNEGYFRSSFLFFFGGKTFCPRIELYPIIRTLSRMNININSFHGREKSYVDFWS